MPESSDDTVSLVRRLAEAQVNKRIGTVLKEKWQIDSVLGAGGMAFVYAARHRNGRRVAIKCMRPELALEPTLVQRFMREGYVANKIEHPGAVAILDDDVAEDGTPFLVMELLSGRTLRERLAEGPLPLDQTLAMIDQLLDVLAVAHEKGVIHRDLKPDNLFLTDDGVLKVLDFGIARLREGLAPAQETRTGATMGTVGFMPPEQARGLASDIDARTDVWAAGATLYALLTGRAVHEAETPNEALLLAMTAQVKPMRELLPWLPPPAQALLDRSLAFDKTQRFADARAMQRALRAIDAGAVGIASTRMTTAAATVATTAASSGLAHTEIDPAYPSPTMVERVLARREASTPEASRTRVLAIAVVSVLAVLVIGAALMSLRKTTERPTTSIPIASLAPPPVDPVPAPPPASSEARVAVWPSASAQVAAPSATPARIVKRPRPPSPVTPSAAPSDTRDPLAPRR